MTLWHEKLLAACRNEAEREAVWADYQVSLEAACAAGRAVAALEKFYAPSKPAVQAEVIGGGDTLAGRIRWLLENRGPLNAEQLSQLLGANPILVRRSCSDMSGTGAIRTTKHPQGKRTFSVVKAMALVLFVALTGCVTKQPTITRQITSPPPLPVARVIAPAVNQNLTAKSVVAPPPVRFIHLGWDRTENPACWYEFASSTNLSRSNSWYFKALIQPTNNCYFVMTNAQEFYAIRAALPVKTGSVTNWIYSEYSQSK